MWIQQKCWNNGWSSTLEKVKDFNLIFVSSSIWFPAPVPWIPVRTAHISHFCNNLDCINKMHTWHHVPWFLVHAVIHMIVSLHFLIIRSNLLGTVGYQEIVKLLEYNSTLVPGFYAWNHHLQIIFVCYARYHICLPVSHSLDESHRCTIYIHPSGYVTITFKAPSSNLKVFFNWDRKADNWYKLDQ